MVGGRGPLARAARAEERARYTARVPVGNWLVLLVALAIVGLDLALRSPWTGPPVLVLMLLVVLAVAERVRQLVVQPRTAAPAGQPAGWLSGVLWRPTTGSRVDWALGLTMARWAPTRRLRREDLPALGRPARAT